MTAVTAVDYLEQQLQLEKEARETLPYEPDRCTYPQPLRQLVFTCLTCSRANDNTPIGVCYSCSIQCHSTHELVELLPKRSFVCDCGTTRMKNGHACELRIKQAKEDAKKYRPGDQGSEQSNRQHEGDGHQHIQRSPSSPHQSSRQEIPKLRAGLSSTHFHSLSSQKSPAEDVPSSSNKYNHNFEGRFCSCNELYNPVKETRTMHQCYFGEYCGEDWFHQDCILGYKPGIFSNDKSVPRNEITSSSNLSSGLDAPLDSKDIINEEEQGTKTDESTSKKDSPRTEASDHEDADSDDDDVVPYFPALDSFSEFICSGCIEAFPDSFDEISNNSQIVAAKLPQFEGVDSAHEWKARYDAYLTGEPQAKKIKTEKKNRQPYTLFLRHNFKLELKKLKDSVSPDSPVGALLRSFEFLSGEDSIYSPDEDSDVGSSTGSLFEMGTEALQTLPGQQAIEGLHAYELMRSRLRDFFQDFVDKNKVVTEDKVRDFFDNLKQSH
ncbi:hypothetical protein ACI3LY_004746 [Candidozyma auris]|uniref:UBR-type domain-containing protein n=2 Tax=Candidozyma auris TaxID=498019 RepID=A0A2H0ZEW3_CANAR|nr:hypothetical protein QG37_06776 [[Candida] auris]PIS48772.1 hypothetical protein B9J08_005477 [[Candida] auris]QWW24489.1 hypothetical protein CA7LBN_003346 [[Candida] auris]